MIVIHTIDNRSYPTRSIRIENNNLIFTRCGWNDELNIPLEQVVEIHD
jgi:hypothetical protein